MEIPDWEEEIEFWRKRAEYYEKMCMTLIADISDGVIFDSITIDENGIRFTKKQPERKRGKWIKGKKSLWSVGTCSVCGAISVEADTANYCKNCGAEMRKETDDA